MAAPQLCQRVQSCGRISLDDALQRRSDDRRGGEAMDEFGLMERISAVNSDLGDYLFVPGRRRAVG